MKIRRRSDLQAVIHQPADSAFVLWDDSGSGDRHHQRLHTQDRGIHKHVRDIHV